MKWQNEYVNGHNLSIESQDFPDPSLELITQNTEYSLRQSVSFKQIL